MAPSWLNIAIYNKQRNNLFSCIIRAEAAHNKRKHSGTKMNKN